MIDITNRHTHPTTDIIDNYTSQFNRNKLLNISLIRKKYLLLFIFLLLSIVGLRILTSVIIIRSDRLIENNPITQQIIDQLTKQNETIQQFDVLRLVVNRTIEQLTEILQQLLREQIKQNKTIQQLFINLTLSNKINMSIVKTDQIDLNQTIDTESRQKQG